MVKENCIKLEVSLKGMMKDTERKGETTLPIRLRLKMVFLS